MYYSGSMKITTHLDHIGHCKTSSGTNWSYRWGHGEHSSSTLAATKSPEADPLNHLDGAVDLGRLGVDEEPSPYRGTSLIMRKPLLGTYSRTMSRALRWS